VLMAAGLGRRSELPRGDHKMLQRVGNSSLLGNLITAADDSQHFSAIVVDLGNAHQAVVGLVEAAIDGRASIRRGARSGYLADTVMWGRRLEAAFIAVDADIWAPKEQLSRCFADAARSDDAAIAHTPANAANTRDPRSGWVDLDAQSYIRTHRRASEPAYPNCTIGLRRISQSFHRFLEDRLDSGVTSITRCMNDYLGAGGAIWSPLLADAVNVNSPQDLRCACDLAGVS